MNFLTEFPERNELVIAVIRKILPYGAFCVLPEYNDMEAFLHVSEIAPRWIKNIHEFISEGERQVVKVHHVDPQKNQVDISIKRVSDEERRRKLELMRTEKRAKKLIELCIKTAKSSIKSEELYEKIEAVYPDVYTCLQLCMEKGDEALKDVDVPKNLKKIIVEISKKNIKKPSIEVSGIVSLTCYGVSGVEDIKKCLSIKEKGVSILYLGAPKYKISLTAEDYKKGEKNLSKIVEHIKEFAMKNNCTFDYEREKG